MRVLRTHGHCCSWFGNLAFVSWFKRELRDNSAKSISVRMQGSTRGAVRAYAKTAFISMIDIVLPMHACGPAMKDRVEKVE